MLIRQTKRDNVPNKDLMSMFTHNFTLALFIHKYRIYIFNYLYYGAFILHRLGPID